MRAQNQGNKKKLRPARCALPLIMALAAAPPALADEGSLLASLAAHHTMIMPTAIHSSPPPAGYRRACKDCHAAMVGGRGDHLYRRRDRLIQNYTQLSQRVHYCSQGAKTGWTPQHTQKVVDYLNRRHYRFKKTAP